MKGCLSKMKCLSMHKKTQNDRSNMNEVRDQGKKHQKLLTLLKGEETDITDILSIDNDKSI